MYEVIIVGSGIVGLVCALLLAKESALRIAILDATCPELSWSEQNYDSRVYALTPASQQVLENLALWSDIQAKRSSPFTRMHVWDEKGGGELIFDHASLNVPALGYIVEDKLLRSTLLEKLKSFSSIDFLCPLRLTALQEEEEALLLHYQDADQPLRCKLLIGADGAHSWVREQAGIALHLEAYQHSALIAEIETEQPHQQTASQVFLTGHDFPNGPLAFLPLANKHHCSLVWSTTPQEAEHLFNLNESSFQALLGEASGFHLGKIQAVSKRQLFPLYERRAARYVKQRLALIGEAAQTLHPLAGQGLNLGLADAAFLAELILEAFKKDRSFASYLRRYERARQSEHEIMQRTVKLLHALFSSKNKNLALLRNQGFIAVQHLPWLKNFFARYAMGVS
ncbi:MAG TPA: UbiH/UbiF/VisC/COQ6 family ubiquinone biosynthesis hydroxylase [Gammaproteobacteria bacterium]|nr:UbiH/UbiF/VisC/COQ6 family ubiquinone biosynthesis hydroxylase [Gammaproteobacteria bacterium]